MGEVFFMIAAQTEHTVKKCDFEASSFFRPREAKPDMDQEQLKMAIFVVLTDC